MKLALSTNWCNRRLETGEEIADEAIRLGFDELELGYNTTRPQAEGFKRRLDAIRVGSVHAFCPVPISAPHGYPELYQLASFESSMRELTRVHVVRNVEFAAEMGADVVVLHAGRVAFSGLFRLRDTASLKYVLKKNGNDLSARKYVRELAAARKLRRARGAKMLDVFKATLESLKDVLEQHRVRLAFENLPYLEGFPDEEETQSLLAAFEGGPFSAWYDTGHARVRASHGWVEQPDALALAHRDAFAGMHLNDVDDFHDDHKAPGFGKVDFAALRPLAESVRHVVFEPNESVSEAELVQGLNHIRELWK